MNNDMLYIVDVSEENKNEESQKFITADVVLSFIGGLIA